MGILNALRKTFGNVDRSTQLLAEIREGIANLTDVVNRRFPTGMTAAGQATGTARADQMLSDISRGLAGLADAVNRGSQAQQRAQEDAAQTALLSAQTLAEIRQALVHLADAMGHASGTVARQDPADVSTQPAAASVTDQTPKPSFPQAIRQVRLPIVEISRGAANAPSPRIGGN